jgi:hypothetical protein
MRHVLFEEDLPAALLRSEPREIGVRAEERDPEPHRQLDLRRRRREREHQRELRVADHAPDPCDRARTLEQLLRQRPVAAVDERDRLEAAARLGRVELGDEAEPVVEDARVDRLRGDVDHPRARRPEQAEDETEEPLLVRWEDRDQLVGDVERDRVDDDQHPLDLADRPQGDVRPALPEL